MAHRSVRGAFVVRSQCCAGEGEVGTVVSFVFVFINLGVYLVHSLLIWLIPANFSFLFPLDISSDCFLFSPTSYANVSSEEAALSTSTQF